MRIERLAFEVQDTPVVGNLHMPDGRGPFPALITGGPMTSVKEQVTGTYAAAMAERGFAALSLDHRHYGQSGGEPRQYEDWEHKVEDLIAGAAALARHRAVASDRIAALGICLGCGYLARAIPQAPEVRGFVAVAGYYRDVDAMRTADPKGFEARVEQGRRARRRYQVAGELDTIPAVALQGDAAMTLESTFDYYARRAQHPNYINAFAVMSREKFIPFDVQGAAPHIRVPFLMVHGPNALSPAWAERFYSRVPATKVRRELASKGQTDIYDDKTIVSWVAHLAADFLRSNI